MHNLYSHINNETRLICSSISPYIGLDRQSFEGSLRVVHPENLLSLLHFHRLYPHFYNVWQPYNVRPVTPEWILFAEKLKQLVAQNKIEMLRKSAVLIKLSELFEKNDIPVITLKGPALSYRLYNDITLKASSDLDILIPEGYLNHAVAMLLENGYHNLSASIPLTPRQLKYARNNFHHFVFTENDRTTKIELHWRAAHLEHLTGLHSNAFWETPDSAVNLGNTPIRIPPPEIEMIYLAAHGAEHGFKRLHWLYDVVNG